MEIYYFVIVGLACVTAGVIGYIIISFLISWYRKRNLSNYGINTNSEMRENFFT